VTGLARHQAARRHLNGRSHGHHRDVPARHTGAKGDSMFTRILVPLDGRDVGAVALTPALTVALATGASIRLLTVLHGPPAPAERDAAETHLTYVAAGLIAKGAAADTTVRVGAPAEEIVAAAAEAGADLIVMATHGRAGLTRAFLGSVAERVLASSPVPVLLVRPGGHGLEKLGTILVPVDGSPGGALALASAAALARSTRARIVLLQVVVPALAYQLLDATGLGGGLYFDPAWDEEALEGARRCVTGLASRLLAAGLAAEGQALIGDAVTPSASVVDAIIAGADRVAADAIVMSTHAHTGAARALLGSVADALVRSSQRPVLLVRRGGAEAAEPAATPAAASARPTAVGGIVASTLGRAGQEP
jgi:nucleotide-binding universal stress UspA family protein